MNIGIVLSAIKFIFILFILFFPEKKEKFILFFLFLDTIYKCWFQEKLNFEKETQAPDFKPPMEGIPASSPSAQAARCHGEAPLPPPHEAALCVLRAQDRQDRCGPGMQ